MIKIASLSREVSTLLNASSLFQAYPDHLPRLGRDIRNEIERLLKFTSDFKHHYDVNFIYKLVDEIETLSEERINNLLAEYPANDNDLRMGRIKQLLQQTLQHRSPTTYGNFIEECRYIAFELDPMVLLENSFNWLSSFISRKYEEIPKPQTFRITDQLIITGKSHSFWLQTKSLHYSLMANPELAEKINQYPPMLLDKFEDELEKFNQFLQSLQSLVTAPV